MNAPKQTKTTPNLLKSKSERSSTNRNHTGINLRAAYTALIQGYERVHRIQRMNSKQVNATKGVRNHE